MNTIYLRAAGVSALALLLVAANGQGWPHLRYHVGADDQPTATAVDHRGNIFVCGKVLTASNGYDFAITSYDSSGNVRSGWPKAYDGAAHGDDVATSLDVDWQGNVIVSGVSYGGSTRKNDFIAIKYNSTADIVWPTSGSGSGFDFHDGAIRLSDNNDDGVDVDDPDMRVCAMAMRNTAGSQPTFAITGPTRSGSANMQWRTVVFEDDANGAVRIKAGWPFTEFGANGDDDQPYAVAIHTDDSVYVTGAQHSSTTNERFTTVRYYPNGNMADPDHYWVDHWENLSGKPGKGKAIALDFSGHAYVTGFRTDGEATLFSTRKIKKDPITGTDPDVAWSDEYAPNLGANEGLSISISNEVVSGVLTPFAYATGYSRSANIGAGATLDIATLRYDGADGTTPVWVRRYTGQSTLPTSYEDRGFCVVAAGNGNCYIVGKTNNGTDFDYVLLGYKKDGTTNRFNPVIYNNSFTDEARSAAMGGAGLVYYTGTSGASSTNLDFLTTRNVESTSPFVTTTVSALGGSTNGGVTELASSDDSYYSIHPYASGGGYLDGVVTFETSVTTSNPSEMSVTIESKVDKNGVWQKVEVYDQLASAWIEVDNQPAVNGTDTNTVIVLRDSPGRFIGSSPNYVAKVRVTHYVLAGYSAGSYYARFDLVRWDVLGQ